MITIGLSEYRRVTCDIYVFPADLFDIPGVEAYDDIEQIEEFAFQKLVGIKDRHWNVYVNSGLSIMLLSVILVAKKLGASLVLQHYDMVLNNYKERSVIWEAIELSNCEAVCHMTLCSARHYGLPEDVIFESIPEDRVMDFCWQERIAEERLKIYAGKHIDIYVTGLTQALVSVLNVASKYNISITCMHYNYVTESYFPQHMRIMEV